jgi:hypothetical protein
MTSTTHDRPADQIARFRAAVTTYEDGVRDRIGATAYADSAASERRWHGGKLRNELLADALDGLDLEASEWGLLRWFISWDSQEVLASIICKAREQGPAVPAGDGRG